MPRREIEAVHRAMRARARVPWLRRTKMCAIDWLRPYGPTLVCCVCGRGALTGEVELTQRAAVRSDRANARIRHAHATTKHDRSPQMCANAESEG